MDRDEEIRLQVVQAFKDEPKLSDPGRIGIAVKDSRVTLTGKVEHYMDIVVSAEAVQRVKGVKGVVQWCEVEFPETSKQNDAEIASSAFAALEEKSSVLAGWVKVVVTDGAIVLNGELHEPHQKSEAENIASKIPGVKRVFNNIVVKPGIRPHDVTAQIERRFQRIAQHHAQEIQVEVKGNKVILSGVVRAWVEQTGAEQAARELPGVTEVENRLEVTPLLEGKETPPPGFGDYILNKCGSNKEGKP